MASRAVARAWGLVLGCACGALAVVGVSLGFARSTDVHAEYVKYASGADSITAYVAYPESAEPAAAVLVIHEIFGMSDFVREAAHRLAKAGFVAVAPDLLSRRGGTPESPDGARKLIASLNPDTLMLDLDAAAAYTRGLPAVDSSRLGVIGFCWGGSESLRYAAHNPSLRAFVVCYGPLPKGALDYRRIKATGFGVYADRDGRVTQSIYNLVKDLHKVDVDYRFTIYPNTGHGFLRTRQPPQAADEAWHDIVGFLKTWLKKA